jgi:hypothetical protein
LLPGIFGDTKLAVNLVNIQINTDRQMIGGEVVGVYDTNMSQIANLDTQNNEIKIDLTVNFVIPYNPKFEYNAKTGILEIYDLSSVSHNVELPKNDKGKIVLSITIKDANGNVYKVSEETYVDANENEQKQVVIEQYDDNKDIDEVIIQGISNNYEIVINEEKEKTTNDRILKLVYEQQKFNMRLQRSNGETINVANIQWQIKTGKSKETLDAILIKEITIEDKDIEVVIYEKIVDKNGKEKKAKIAAFTFVVKQSPYITFSTSKYDGEFGFDDGEDFKENSVPKQHMQYDTIHVADNNGKSKVLYVPWVTLLQGQSVRLDVKLSRKIEGDNIYAEATSSKININYNKQQNQLTVTNNGLDNNFNDKEYINFYRDDKYGLQKHMLIGRCAIISRQSFNPINVQIVYFASDTTRMKNTVNTTRLQTLLNSNSMNQAFARFTVLPNIIRVKEALSSTIKVDYKAVYKTILNICQNKGMKYTDNQHPTTVYVIMTELQYTKLETNGIVEERGGGVLNNCNFAIMWSISSSGEDKEKLIIHEIGHTLGLRDVFLDNTLGRPSVKFSRNNYMDYNVVRKMFFKTQVETIINNLNKK